MTSEPVSTTHDGGVEGAVAALDDDRGRMAGSVPALPSVAVASELAMVAEAVAAALAHRGFAAVVMQWPTGQRKPGRQAAASLDQQAGLLICDFGSWERLRAAWLLITHAPLPWVVLTQAPKGPRWGAALDAGACLVLPSTTGLEAVCSAVDEAACATVQMEADEQDELVRLWAGLLERREMVNRQIASLTPREREVLAMLHAGDRIARIAQLLGISPVTVRSQVKAVLRKLDVNSQLGAVAALDDLLGLEPWG
jgi:DNA-binding NarL/FixJ family response regulator